jgi:hypothetical protein
MIDDGGIQYQQQVGQQEEQMSEDKVEISCEYTAKLDFAKALAKAQGEMQSAKKEKDNPQFRGSKYADLSSVLDAIRTPFSSNGLSLLQSVVQTDKAEVCIKTVIMHSSGYEYDCGIVSVPVSKHDAQGYGSATTYARRYGLHVAGLIATEDDDGNAAVAGKNLTKPNLAFLPQPNFDKKATEWRAKIIAKEGTAKDLIAMLSTKYQLTDEQKLTIDSWSHEE